VDTSSWLDETGVTHAGCSVHRDELRHRYPARVETHGRLRLDTPWPRQYLPEDKRPEVEAEIPQGATLAIGATERPGHAWVLVLFDSTGQLWREEWRADPRRYPLADLCLRSLAKHAAVAA